MPLQRSDDTSRTVYNFLVRTTGNRGLSKRLLVETFRQGECDRAGLLQNAKRLAAAAVAIESRLRLDTVHLAGFAGRTDPDESVDPDLPALERDLKSRLDPVQLLAVELVFVEKLPVVDVANLYGTTEKGVMAFLSTLVTEAALPAGPTHAPDCEPEATVAGVLVAQLAGAPIEARPCPACPGLVREARWVLQALARDSRLFSLTDFDHIRNALQGPKVDLTRAAKPVPVRTPSKHSVRTPPPAVPSVRKIPAAPAIAGTCVLLAVLATLMTGGIAETREPVHTGSVASPAVSQGARGSYGEPGRRPHPLAESATVAASSRAPVHVSLNSGASLELSPGALVKINGTQLTLGRGHLRVRIPESVRDELNVRLDAWVVQLNDGEFEFSRRTSGPTRMHVRSGSLVATDAAGRSRVLRMGQQLDT